MKLLDLPTADPVKGRKIVKSIIVVCCVVAAMVVLVLQAVLWAPAEPVVTKCSVDTVALGVLSEDLCNLVPEAIRQRNNVVVTGGFDTFPSIIRIKDVPNTVYYNLLTPQQQINTLVKTSGIRRTFEKYGFFGGMLGGVILVFLLSVFFRIGKKILQERKRAIARQVRQEQIRQRAPSDKRDIRELNLDSVQI
jgi:hypothetical protein